MTSLPVSESLRNTSLCRSTLLGSLTVESTPVLEERHTKFKNPIEILMSQEDMNCLAQLACWANPETVVEIGSWAGGSSRILSCFAKRVYCIDHWMEDFPKQGLTVCGEFAQLQPRERFVQFCKNMEDYLHVEIFPCVGPSETWAAVWRVPIDFL